MKISKLFLIPFSLLAMTSCNNVVDEISDAEFSLDPTIQSLSRVPELDESGAGKFSTGDQNTLFFHTSTKADLGSFLYTYGQAYHWSDLKLPADVTECEMAACYPTIETETPTAYEWNVTAEGEVKDLLLAPAKTIQKSNATKISTTFSHALHQLKVELSADPAVVSEETLNAATIDCKNFKPIATLNLTKGTVTGSKGTLSNFTSKGKTVTFLIPAQEVGTMAISIKVNDGSADRLFNLPLSSIKVSSQPLAQLEQGKTFTIRIKVNKTGFSILSNTISGWGSQGESDNTIVI